MAATIFYTKRGHCEQIQQMQQALQPILHKQKKQQVLLQSIFDYGIQMSYINCVKNSNFNWF